MRWQDRNMFLRSIRSYVQMRNRFPSVGAVPGGPAMRMRSTILGAGLGALVRNVPFLILF